MDKQTKKQEMQLKMKERKKEVKTVRKIVAIVTAVLLFIFVMGSFIGYKYVTTALEPVNPDATAEVTVQIPLGSGVSAISQILEEHEIVKNAQIFKYYAKFKNESQFQAGDYTFTQSMTIDEILETLKTGKLYRTPVFSLTIPEGLTLEQMADRVAEKTNHSAEAFMKTVTEDAFIDQMIAEYPELITDEVKAENIRYDLEGYLYPATYPFYSENPTVEEIIETMISAMNTKVLEYKGSIEERQMTVHQYLTFASLLEEEATATTDRETIASVFYNRLAIDMPLQTDPTVLYSLGEHKNRVLYADLEVDHPYNTYKNKGLPPGPIAGAGQSSLEAAIAPSETEYFYFLADENGANHFAKTYEEHLVNVDKYIK